MNEPVAYNDNVFINCPFDKAYKPFLWAIIFAIQDCDFTPRCAQEEDNAGDIRIQKIMKIIDECRYGIHDISKADLDEHSQLARFNMPLELGIFLAAHYFAPPKNHNKNKRSMIMDLEPFRYQKFISDLSGQDIKAHGSEAGQIQVSRIIQNVRDFLATSSRRKLSGAAYIAGRYDIFLKALPAICEQFKWEVADLTFLDYLTCVTAWIQENRV